MTIVEERRRIDGKYATLCGCCLSNKTRRRKRGGELDDDGQQVSGGAKGKEEKVKEGVVLKGVYTRGDVGTDQGVVKRERGRVTNMFTLTRFFFSCCR